MEQELSAAEARRIRQRNGWSLQYLANISRINKAYLSEFETGQRSLPSETLQSLKRHLLQEPAGRAAPRIKVEGNHHRLTFVDPLTEEETSRPPIAHIKWTEPDGSTYSMYVGEQ